MEKGRKEQWEENRECDVLEGGMCSGRRGMFCPSSNNELNEMEPGGQMWSWTGSSKQKWVKTRLEESENVNTWRTERPFCKTNGESTSWQFLGELRFFCCEMEQNHRALTGAGRGQGRFKRIRKTTVVFACPEKMVQQREGDVDGERNKKDLNP